MISMPYRSTDKTRQRKDAKRTAMMQAAMRVFAQKGYHDATVRDIVSEADVAIGTFYFYFPDKETLFVHLFEETAAFLLQAIDQALSSRPSFPTQLEAAVQAYVNVAFYEPAVVQLLLVGGNGIVAVVERAADGVSRKAGARLATDTQHGSGTPPDRAAEHAPHGRSARRRV